MSYHCLEEWTQYHIIAISQEKIGKNHHEGATSILQIYGIN